MQKAPQKNPAEGHRRSANVTSCQTSAGCGAPGGGANGAIGQRGNGAQPRGPTPHPCVCVFVFCSICSVALLLLRTGSRMDDGVFAALIGAVVFTALLLLVCSAALLLWSSSRHKGSYVTNETEEDQEDREDREDQEDDYRGGNL
ncbi:uncharacterized protein AB9W97_008377 isoform 1-T1 [Spinachia spinachia]